LHSFLEYFTDLHVDLSLHTGGCRISTMLLFIPICRMALRYMLYICFILG